MELITPKQSYPLFDYLRFFAALGVFVAHSDNSSILPHQLGNASVQLFFALSGFLIGGILLRSHPDDIPRFFFNRTTRIWIPYFIAIALVLAATMMKQSLRDPKLWEFFLYDATFVYNIFGPPQLAAHVHRMPLDGTANHFWSICVEEQFYLFSPFFVIFLRKTLLIPILIGSAVINFVLPHDFSAISLGVLLALIQIKHINGHPCLSRFIFPSIILTGLILIWQIPTLYQFIFPIVACATVGLLATNGERKSLGRILGGISYPFYLNAWVAGFAVNFAVKANHLTLPHYVLSSATLVVALLFSYGHYRFVDSVILDNRSAYFTRSAGILCYVIATTLFGAGLAVGFFLSFHPVS